MLLEDKSTNDHLPLVIASKAPSRTLQAKTDWHLQWKVLIFRNIIKTFLTLHWFYHSVIRKKLLQVPLTILLIVKKSRKEKRP